jgi:hypothetical protein
MDLGIDDHRRSFRSGLRFGMCSVEQSRPGRSQRRPGPQHAAPVDKPVFGNRLVDHFSLHGTSEPRSQLRSLNIEAWLWSLVKET